MLSRTILRFLVITMMTFISLCSGLIQAAEQQLKLSEQERTFLASLDIIRVCADPDWLPYEGIDKEGRFIGIMSDFHHYWSELLGTPIQLQRTDDWQHSLSLMQNKQCDVLSSAQDMPDRRSYLAFTKPFIFYPLAVATQPDNTFIINLHQVIDKRFVMVEGYAGVDLVRDAYPGINLSIVKSAAEGLKKVETGRAHGYIDTVPSINFQTSKHGISHIKINGILDQRYAMSVGIRTDLPLLLSSYNKAIAATTEETRQRILNKWLSLSFQQNVDITWLWRMLLAVAVVVALFFYRYLIVNKHNRELQRVNKKLQKLSQRDHLTGMHNRYYLDQAFQHELTRHKRYQHGFAIVMLDIDHFKQINDSYGHVVGDEVIKQVANVLSENVREQDVVARWGGEEFLILTPETGLEGMRKLAENLRQLIRRNAFTVDNINVTVSFGVTDYRDGEEIEATIQRADLALYQAKQSGRDKTVVF